MQDRFKVTFKSIKTCKTLRETTTVTRALKKVHLLRYTNGRIAIKLNSICRNDSSNFTPY